MQRRGLHITLVLAVAADPWLAARPVAAAEGTASASRVKAAFVCNFTQFVAWPPDGAADANGQFVLGVLCGGHDGGGDADDDDAFCDTLTRLAAGKTAGGHPIAVKRVTALEDAAACQALYVPPSQDDRVAGLFAAIGRRPVLTVGDSEPFAAAGGIIRFVPAGGKVRFEVRTAAAAAAGLRVSSKLLKVAIVINH
jgi:hypothetical protein